MNHLFSMKENKMYIRNFFAVTALCFLCGCFNPVLRIGDNIVPLRNYNGVPCISARSPIHKEIHYSTFGFDWDEKDNFFIPRKQNSVNRALWISKRTQAEKLYTVVAVAEKQRHYIQKPDIKVMQQYLESTYRPVPGSKIKLTELKMEPGNFKGVPAVYVYMETFEVGRELCLREESYYFFDPAQPEVWLYKVGWSERGKKSDWRSPEAEIQGRRFFHCFKLLSEKK